MWEERITAWYAEHRGRARWGCSSLADISPGPLFFFKELQNWDVLVEQKAVPEYTKVKGSAGSHSGLQYCVCPFLTRGGVGTSRLPGCTDLPPSVLMQVHFKIPIACVPRSFCVHALTVGVWSSSRSVSFTERSAVYSIISLYTCIVILRRDPSEEKRVAESKEVSVLRLERYLPNCPAKSLYPFTRLWAECERALPFSPF